MPEHLDIVNYGTVAVVTPLTEYAREWFDNNVMTEETIMWAGGVCIEPRYMFPLLEGFFEDVGEVES